MPGAGASRFTDPEDFQERLPFGSVRLVVTEHGAFDARLVWAKLPNLLMLSVAETLSRVAYASLSTDSLFLSFTARSANGLRWNGTELLPGDIVVHGQGERLHQRVSGPCHWGLLVLAPAFLTSYGSAFAGRTLRPPEAGQILRPPAKASLELLNLHTRVARLVETRPASVGDPELSHAVEQEFLQTLVPCLINSPEHGPSKIEARNVLLMADFERLIAEQSGQPLTMRELCANLGISDRTLGARCAEFLGTSPIHYLLLRRLSLARAEIRRSDPASAHVGEIARRFGFTEPSRFSFAYKRAYGEPPSTTLHRPRDLMV
jgi:AraC-like DNA-binding protein